jgi:nicotinamide-nucleotide amidase
MKEELLSKVSELLKAKKLTLATAESCTGGMLSNLLTNVSGSSDYFERGVVTYSNRAKMELLEVSAKTLEKWGAVSNEVAKEMAVGIRKQAGTDIGISTTGIAGPLGGSKEKPVGLVYIAGAWKRGVEVKQYRFKTDRLGNKKAACEAALNLILSIARRL